MHFIIQIIGTSQYIIYHNVEIKPKRKRISAFLYANEVIHSNFAQNKFHICNNKFLSYISRVFNNEDHSPNVSEYAVSLFYSVSPKSPKIQRQGILKSIQMIP